jgi:phosphopantothenoylcysteine decarboxylase / phosphopantothenate---cysteine ligase
MGGPAPGWASCRSRAERARTRGITYLSGRGRRNLPVVLRGMGELPATVYEGRPMVGRRITLCVGGSIAAYKSAMLARLLLGAGALVQAVMTRSAQRFVGRATLSGLTGRPVHVDMFRSPGELHVELARDSDLIVVVPATADLLARLAHGRADDLVTATLLCARCPVLLAPAMHPQMWTNPLTRANVETLSRLPGWRMLGPAFGEVASGEVGLGRMLEPSEIARAIAAELTGPATDDGLTPNPCGPVREHSVTLAGRHVVITAGPTVEDLDPVRSLTNRSSGKMGFAIARSAARQGALVTLISGPVALPTPVGVERVNVRSALDMQAALAGVLGEGLRGADALVMCAAVADYRPRISSLAKLKRSSSPLSLELVPNPDLLAEIGQRRASGVPLLLGFAVETEGGERLVAAAREKLIRKHVDAIVANSASDALGTDDTKAMLVTADTEQVLGPASKADVADEIVTWLASRLA